MRMGMRIMMSLLRRSLVWRRKKVGSLSFGVAGVQCGRAMKGRKGIWF